MVPKIDSPPCCFYKGNFLSEKRDGIKAKSNCGQRKNITHITRTMNTKKSFQLKARGSVAYLALLDFPHEHSQGCAVHTVDIHYLLENYCGPRISIDFDSQNRPIGIEIVYPSHYHDGKEDDDDEGDDEIEEVDEEDGA
jgi:hypothetical protein